MKKLSFLIAITVLVACSNHKKEKKEGDGKNDRIELTPFILTKIILKDTTQIKTIYAQTDSGKITMSDYKSYYDDVPMYLDKNQFRQFELAMWELINKPGSNVYVNGAPTTSLKLKERLVICDSVIETSFDQKGNEVIRAVFACDSVTPVRSINMIRFGETWYYNNATKMIDREILCYSVYQWDSERQGFRSVFEVYRDDESRKKALKYNFW